MNFFERQDAARKKTRIFILYFIVCVALIIVGVYLAVIGFVQYISAHSDMAFEMGWWREDIFILTAGATVLIIFFGSLYKIISLRGGGRKVAELLGGRLIPPATDDLKERQLLNVVEEMSIASGVAVPPVYVLEENGINAFAAGFSPKDAVVTVTRGSLENLSRDELQGVIAHEFSHIFNGDMRLNIRLMGVLNGILVIAILGEIFLRSRGRRNPLPLLGILLMAVGYVGIFFGKLIQAAVCREREFLADASAVQFTRNPDGIGGALKKIGTLEAGSRLQHPNAREAGHFYFANGLREAWLHAFATHPSLVERIKRIDPTFDGKLAVEKKPFAKDRFEMVKEKISIDPESLLAGIGNPKGGHLFYAMSLLAGMPTTLAGPVREPKGAQKVVYALLGQEDGEFQALINKMGPKVKLPLLDLALPALKLLSKEEYETFRKNVRELILKDKKIDLFEFVLEHVLIKNLDPHFGGGPKRGQEISSMDSLGKELDILLSAVAHSEGDLQDVARALEKLSLATPKLKEQIVKKVIDAIQHDGTVTLEEGEFLRAVCDALDCPMPPFAATE